MDIRGFFANLIYILPAVAIALSVHEFAHAFVSYKLGDISQKQRGRLTLKHLDPFGTLSLIFFGFGWQSRYRWIHIFTAIRKTV